MRKLAFILLASFGVAGAVLPCAAQSTIVTGPQSITVAKQATPERLAPPQAETPSPPVQVLTTKPTPLPVSPPGDEAYAPQSQAYAPPEKPMPAASSPAQASPDLQGSFTTAERLMDWISNYRKHPNPRASRRGSRHGGLRAAARRGEGVVLHRLHRRRARLKSQGRPRSHPEDVPAPDKEQAVIIRAIVYSGRPDWRDLLEKNSSRMPLRRPLIDDFLQGKRPTLMELPLVDGGTPGIYALWGYYVATGAHEPVVRIMQALQWSRNKDDHSFSFKKIFSGWGGDASAVDKITTGGTAKWTLASYAERDRDLLNLYRSEAERQPESISKPLKDVIVAAEAFESETIRKDQFGAIEDAQKQQMSNEAGMSKGATAGSIAIATGCVAATALGQPEIAIPCVIGGALYTGAVKLSH
jgi:hypothetical protein